MLFLSVLSTVGIVDFIGMSSILAHSCDILKLFQKYSDSNVTQLFEAESNDVDMTEKVFLFGVKHGRNE